MNPRMSGRAGGGASGHGRDGRRRGSAASGGGGRRISKRDDDIDALLGGKSSIGVTITRSESHSLDS